MWHSLWGSRTAARKRHGPEDAPILFCSDEYLEQIERLNWKVNLFEAIEIDIPSPSSGRLHNPHTVAATCELVKSQVMRAHEEGDFPILIGGDHSLAMGSICGSAATFPDLRVLWFDAHADINTPETSPSGNIHGMPLAMLLGLAGTEKAPGFEGYPFKCLKPENIAYIGLRDVDTGESEILTQLGIKHAYYMKDVDEHGMDEIVQRALTGINPQKDKPMHISFDVDGCDPVDFPSTGTPVRDGIRLHEALRMIELINETGCLVSADVMEINPELGTRSDVELTVMNARLVTYQLLGKR